MGYLSGELRRLLDIVVADGHGVLDPAQRQADLDALLALLVEVAAAAVAAPQQAQIQGLRATPSAALLAALAA